MALGIKNPNPSSKDFKLFTEQDVAARLADEKQANISLLEEKYETALARLIKDTWQTNRRHRMTVTNRLIECLRARKGEYSPSQEQQIMQAGGAKPIYLKLTATKCRAAAAWIRDIVMPTGERAFSLKPTSMPSLPVPIAQSIRESAKQEAISLMQLGMMGQNMEEVVEFMERVRDEAMKQIDEEAMERSERMEERIADLMDEGDWDESFEGFIEDFVTYPTAFVKGPYIMRKRTLKWTKENTPDVADEILLGWKRVSPFDIYPAPFSKTLQEGDFIEHIRFDKTSLYNLIGIPGYSDENIRAALGEYEFGGLRNWIWEDWERNRLESDSPFYNEDSDMIDACHFWGYAQGKTLKDWGVKDALDDEKPYPVDAILIGKYVIRAEVNDDPTGMRPYHQACWDMVPGSLWGTALPEQMDDHQKMVNACARALANNMALASGPQAVVYADMIAEGENIRSMYPFKIWQAKHIPMSTQNTAKPVEFFQPPSNAQELLGVLESFEKKSDDVTNVPRYTYGNEKIGGAGNTASGLSMLMNSAAKGIRRAIANIDSNIIRPSLTQAFTHVMLHDPDESLKGDCKVVARGAASLLLKEQNLVRIQTFLNQTANPFDMQILGMKGRAQLLREVGKLMDIDMDGIIPSKDEIEMLEKQQQMAMQQQQQAAAGPQGAPTAPGAPEESIGNQQQMEQNKLDAGTQTG